MSNIITLATEDDLKYTFYPVTSGSVQFKVRAAHDAHLALTSTASESDPMYEVMIGGWGNTKSVIRKNRTKPDKVEVETPDILNAGEFRGFWIRWDSGSISAGREGEAVPFLSWDDNEPVHISHVGVCTGWGATGTWQIEVSPKPVHPGPIAPGGAGVWVAACRGQVPPNAFVGGEDGEPMYVARAHHEGALLPGKLVPSQGVAYVAWGGGEHGKPEYEVLCDSGARWIGTSGANIPNGAVPAGESEEGEPLFIGRVSHEGTVTVGKVHPSHGTCYIAYGGQELGFTDFDVLVA